MSAVRVAEVASGRNSIANDLLQLFRLRKAPPFLAAPKSLVLERNAKDPLLPRDKRHLPELILERRQELLRYPRGTEEPATLRAVFNAETGFGTHR